MRLPHVSRWLGLGLAGVVALLVAARPALKAGPPAAAVATAAVGGAFGGNPEANQPGPPRVFLASPPMSPEAAKTHAKLQEKVGMNFPNETTLTEIKKYIEEVTADKDDPNSGVPLYFSPNGLQDADKTMESTVTIAFRKPIPLATSLRLMLDQLRLRYAIQEDGIVYITSPEDDKMPTDPAPLILNHLADLRAEVNALREEVRLSRGEPLPKPAPGAASVGGPMPGSGGGGMR